MILALLIIVVFVASVNLILTGLIWFGLRQPTTLFLWMIQVFTSAISPVLFLVALLTIVFGFTLHSQPAIALGILSAFLYFLHIVKIIRGPERADGFESAFDPLWESRIPQERQASFLSSRYVLRLPDSPEPIFNPNVSYYTIPGTNRQLLCDIWQPPKSVKHTELAFIYIHGGAWTALDKDFGTRAFFRHLANQGHLIMDISYRLYPETDFKGMVCDAKHAVAWIKANAAFYGVNPDRIIIGGGSAGGHIALLVAYTDQNKELMPHDLASVDISVHGVISFYGQSDLAATYYHTCQHLATRSALAKQKEGEPGGMPGWIQKSMGEDYHRLGFDKDVEPGMLAPILGGNPDEKPESYSLFSPITHVHTGCPPTLILHGEHDILAPVKAIRELNSRLKKTGVPTVMHILPQTDHAFDLILPKISPSAHNAFYDVERFMALMALKKQTGEERVADTT
jgi:acetyl esterase/lipase